VDRRGRFWGLTSSLGVGLGVLASLLSAWLLRRYLFPASFVYIFGLAAAVISVGWVFLSLTREPPHSPAPGHGSQRQFFASLPGLVRRDRGFRRFLVGRSFLALGAMGIGFVTVAAIHRWGVSDQVVGTYTAAALLGQAGGNLFSGVVADRRGHKVALEAAALAYLASFLLAALAPAPAWYYAVFMLVGAGQGIVVVSGIMVVFEFASAERLPTYVGIANTTVGVVSVVGPLLATALASFDYVYAFAASAAASLGAWAILRWRVQDPRWATPPT
jgi:predicted MFS family arabinose efflux permease